MNISAIDASSYFKGLLLLIRKDRKVTESEVHLMKRIGKALGFEEEFCDQAIKGILENEHVRDLPPKFSTKDLAMKFVQDGLVLAYSDSEMHPAEEEWLKLVAELNGLGVQWFSEKRLQTFKETIPHPHLEVEQLTVDELKR
ncbi:MAG: hypothetical protein WEB33_02715 [Bacteroidota bacterium]